MKKDKELYKKHKKIKNFIKTQDLNESLFAIWGYFLNLSYGKKLPSDITPIQEFIQAEKKRRYINEWSLEFLLREVIKYSQSQTIHIGNITKKSLLDSNNMRKAINRTKDIRGSFFEVFEKDINTDQLVQRVRLRQIPWQSKRLRGLQRYYKYYFIFSQEKLREIIREKFALEVEKLFTISILFFGHFLKDFTIIPPVTHKIEELDHIKDQELTLFLDIFSQKKDKLKNKLIELEKHNLNFLLGGKQFLPLRNKPIIQLDNNYVCPNPFSFFIRTTEKIYHDIVGEDSFDNPFGNAFFKYTGKVLTNCFDRSDIVLSETEYNQGEDTVDWLCSKKRTNLFIECKTKKLTEKAQLNFRNKKNDEDIEKMAIAIKQTYKNIQKYQKNLYPNKYEKPENTDINLPIIVTLEDWFLTPKLKKKLNKCLKNELKQEGIPLKYLKKYPYLICSIDKLEILLRVYNENNYKKKVGELKNKAKIRNENNKFLNIIKYLNKENFDYNFLFTQEVNDLLGKSLL